MILLSEAECTLAVRCQAGKYISEATFMIVSIISSDLSFQDGHDECELDIFQRKWIQNNSSDTGDALEQPSWSNQEIRQLTMKYLT